MADKISGKEAQEAFDALKKFYAKTPMTLWAWEILEKYVAQQSKMGRPVKGTAA